jgi:ribosomal protein S18 acetylase RimI-like enzyme
MHADLLANPTWHALNGPHAAHALGRAGARRYAPGFAPLIAFADPQRPDFDALRPHTEAREALYCDGWGGLAPAGWQVMSEIELDRMVWQGGAAPTERLAGLVRLGPEHRAAVLALAARTHPGPFGERSTELGEFLGCFEQGRLIAMAGERMQCGPFREICSVATDPDHQGRGLARRLTALLIQHQLARGETPLLHVRRGNAVASGLYERMGFARVLTVPGRIVQAC